MTENVITGTFTATGQSDAISVKGRANILIDGGSGVVTIERSTDDGSTWYAISKDADGNPATYDTSSLNFNGWIDEPEHRIKYRLNCTGYTSGTITYRIATER